MPYEATPREDPEHHVAISLRKKKVISAIFMSRIALASNQIANNLKK